MEEDPHVSDHPVGGEAIVLAGVLVDAAVGAALLDHLVAEGETMLARHHAGAPHLGKALGEEAPKAGQVVDAGLERAVRVAVSELRLLDVGAGHLAEAIRHLGAGDHLGRSRRLAGAAMAREATLGRALEDPERAEGGVDSVDA